MWSNGPQGELQGGSPALLNKFQETYEFNYESFPEETLQTGKINV